MNPNAQPTRVESFDRSALAQLLEPPYTDPYVRWCGRGGAARLPLSRSMTHTDIAPCRCHAALMHGAEAKARAPLCSDALPLYHHAKTTGIQRSLRQGEDFHASQHYRRARAPVVGSGADRLRGRAATG